jgi:hypothetical protein
MAHEAVQFEDAQNTIYNTEQQKCKQPQYGSIILRHAIFISYTWSTSLYTTDVGF